MGLSKPLLPQELLDHIVDNLQHDRKTLQSCALTSPCLLQRCQKQLFSNVHITSSTLSQHFLNLLQTNPVIASYVTELSLTDRIYRPWVAADKDFLVILQKSYRSLESFTLELNDCAVRINPAGPTISALSHILTSPRLSSITMIGLLEIPSNIFNSPMNLKYLCLRRVGFKKGCHLISSSGTSTQSLLVDIAGAQAIEESLAMMRDPKSLFSRIVMLTIPTDQPLVTQAIVLNSVKSLRSLTLLVGHSYGVSNMSLRASLMNISLATNLECLAIEFVVWPDSTEPIGPQVQRGCGVVLENIINSFSTASPSIPCMPRFMIVFNLDFYERRPTNWAVMFTDVGKHMHWSDLDYILWSMKGATFHGGIIGVTMRLAVDTDEELDAAWETWSCVMKEKMPLLYGDNRLIPRVELWKLSSNFVVL